MNFHPLRKYDPLPSESEVCARMQGIRDQGLKHPVIWYEGQILVGRADYLACRRLNIEPRFRVMARLTDPMAFVRAEKARRLKEAASTQSQLNNRTLRHSDVTPTEGAQEPLSKQIGRAHV